MEYDRAESSSSDRSIKRHWKAIAMELARTGALVIVNYNGSREKAEEVKAQIEAEGNQAEIRQCNVADSKSCEEDVPGNRFRPRTGGYPGK